MVREKIDKLIEKKRIICRIENNDKLILNNIHFNKNFSFVKEIFKDDSFTSININFDKKNKEVQEAKETILIKISTIDISNMFYTNDYQQIDINDIKEIIFEDCTFYSLPTIENDDIWLISFVDCEIKICRKIVSLLNPKNKDKKVYFNDCKLDKLEFGTIQHIQYHSNIKLCYFEINGGSITNLTIKNIQLSSKLYINRNNDKSTIIDKLIIKDSEFKENLKFHNCKVNHVSIRDSDFEKQFDCYKSTFENGNKDKTIYFENLNIKGLFIFDNVTFYEKVKFEYVTFESSGNFRYATFKKGLDLDTINIQEDKVINFYRIKELEKKYSKQETSQETYRIIKHNFEKLGNKIESNKFHSLELNANRKELWKSCESSFNLCERKIVSLFHFIFSNHSQSFIIPLFWIIIVSLITNELLLDTWNYNAEYLSIIADIKLSDNPWIFLFHKVSLGYLYYQFLTAVRKDTRK